MRVVVSLAQPTVDALLEQAARAGADLIEARLDRLDRLDAAAVARVIGGSPVPVLVTVRPTTEGGGFTGAPEEREALLLAALEAGAYAVDVESSAPFRERILAKAQATGGRVVVSFHDFQGTPSAADLAEYFRDATAAGAWVAKAAVTVRHAEDAAQALEAALLARRAGLPYSLMAMEDPFLRLLAPMLGQALVYARAPDGAATAPGQVTARTLHRLQPLLPGPGPHTRPIFILGHPVRHTASPAMQNAALRAAGIDAVYLAADLDAGRLAEAVRALPALGALGANVTIPYKQAVLHHVDALGEEASAAGAANTLVVRDGSVIARNTDGVGALSALHEAGVAAAETKVLLLGAGGTARAVAHALSGVGAHLAIANRNESRAKELARTFPADVLPWDERSLAAAAAKADLLVNATSLGLNGEPVPIPAEVLRPGLSVLDCPYRPGGTPLAQAAAEAGCVLVRGESMLLHQGAVAFELWTGQAAPMDVMRQALNATLGVRL